MTKKTDKPAAFVFGKRPETISGTVEFPLPDGTSAKLDCKFKYRTRKEFGALWDEIAGASLAVGAPQPDASKDEADKDAEDAPKFTFAGMFERGDEANADNALKYLAAWNEEHPALTKDTLTELFDQAPAAPAAIWNAYRQLCTTGRLGN